MSILLFVALLLGFYFALGRSAQSSTDRPPLRSLSAREAGRTVLEGMRTLTRLHAERWPDPWADEPAVRGSDGADELPTRADHPSHLTR